MNDKTTFLTARGQISVPASIRREAGLKPGQLMRWERLSDTELRVVVDRKDVSKGAFAALGYARRWLPAGTTVRTDDVLRDLRAGEDDCCPG